MTFSRRAFLTAAVVFSCVFSGFSTASAYGLGCSRGSARYSWRQPVYRHAQPVYRHVQPVIRHVQPVVPVQQVAPVQQVPVQQVPVQPTTPGAVNPGLQPAAGTQVPTQQSPGVGRPPGGGQSQGIPAPAPQRPLQSVGPAPAGTNGSQSVVPPSQPVQPDARMTALQALGGFAPPASSAAPATPAVPQAPAHVGQWSATAGQNASISLNLNADGTFLWRAVNASGSASDFSGRYRIAEGRLTLTRTTDGQNLSGAMQQTDAGSFRFQVTGTNAAPLTFARR